MSNHITVIGTVATAPQEIGAGSQTSFCTFRLACNERRYDREKNEWVDGPTNWVTVNAFRSLGAHAKDSFAIGDRVIATGRLRVRRWERDDKTGTAVEIEADALGHDLRWGVSKFQKLSGAAKSQPGAAAALDEPVDTSPSSVPPLPDGFTPHTAEVNGFAGAAMGTQ